MSKIVIAASPLTGTIYSGTVLKSGLWRAGKQDVTMDCLVATAESVLKKHGGAIEITEADGTKVFEITVKDLR